VNNTLKLLGNRIREIRKAKGHTQTSLAEKCGFNFSYIGGIERAENNVSVKNLEKIADALEVEVYELFIDYKSTKEMMNKDVTLDEIWSLLTSLDTNDLKKAQRVLNEFFVK
jgi:transcriptional regulator with XRE-family HTH domain